MSESTPSGPELRYCDTAAELDQLEPLWNALQEHHAQITPALGGRAAKRPTPEAWRIRRSKYERWLRDPDTFFIVAGSAGAPAGYAFVTVGMPYASWDAGERLAELETLSVLSERRGAGIGAALLEAAWARLEEIGVEDMQITTTVTNLDAQRFYERHGFRRGFVVYYGKSPGRTRAP
jgi:ribosomal protein S18 acetylase RimI-like enzyme